MEDVIGKEDLMVFKKELQSLFLGDADAVNLAIDILYVVNVWDDLIDGDEVSAKNISTAFRKTIYDIPMNPIMCKELSILWLSCYHQWLAANEFETEARDSGLNKSYMLRAAVFQIFHRIATIVGGFSYGESVAKQVYELYGESLSDIKEEFKIA